MAYQGGEEFCRPNQAIVAYWYSLSMIILSGLFAVGWRVTAGVGGWKVENFEKIGSDGRRSAKRQPMEQMNVSITNRLAGYVRTAAPRVAGPIFSTSSTARGISGKLSRKQGRRSRGLHPPCSTRRTVRN